MTDTDPQLERVRKLLAKAEDPAVTEAEAELYNKKAAELIAQHGCHLVITDLEMPRMTGYELMAQMRQSPTTRRIPVMVVTSRAGAKHRDRAMMEGAVAFLTKPVQEDQLIAAVEQLMGTEATRSVVPVA